jgi:hypothetical protein
MGTGTQLRAPQLASRSLEQLDLRGCGDRICPHAWLALLAGCPALTALHGFPEALLRALPPGAWAPTHSLDGAYTGLLLRAAPTPPP